MPSIIPLDVCTYPVSVYYKNMHIYIYIYIHLIILYINIYIYNVYIHHKYLHIYPHNRNTYSLYHPRITASFPDTERPKKGASSKPLRTASAMRSDRRTDDFDMDLSGILMDIHGYQKLLYIYE